ncbi:MAG TPA: hypothetical protein DCP03_06585 [Polaromonas sp.]|nr:hypothetical protein [Polaromonas sp.]
MSSFAQSAPDTTPAEAGAKLVAERDAAWLRAHPGGAEVKEPMALNNAKHVKRAKHVKHVKRAKHTVKKGGMTNANTAKPQK